MLLLCCLTILHYLIILPSSAREQVKVIRIRPTSADSKKANQFQIAPDETNAGVKFSAQECDVTNMIARTFKREEIEHKYKDLFAQIMGATIDQEPLHQAVRELTEDEVKVLSTDVKTKLYNFRRYRHPGKKQFCSWMTHESQTMIQRQSDRPQKFTEGTSPQHAKRRAQYLKNANAYRKEYLESHASDFIDGEKPSLQQNDNSVKDRKFDADINLTPLEKLASDIPKYIFLNKTTGDRIHFENLRSHVGDASGIPDTTSKRASWSVYFFAWLEPFLAAGSSLREIRISTSETCI
ncbi:unnamed protein product [Clonostachys rosea f. rosea IK726]|uniref:Uncharacterized protein n=1 Tax=Clonostachys rosea f. rosea IK726 TaxID=1349383 RepID=A0ACA9TC28_BIOOC|nr:unnamed protein product [Clonostachys rosea f. rosea IK726]